jgi:hypothetical protein
MRLRGNLLKDFGTLFMSPNENKLLQESYKHEHGKNFQHILQIHIRPNCNVKVFERLKKEMLHSCFHFHFAHVNIFSKHSCIPMSNNKMWEITQQTIALRISNFLGLSICKQRHELIIKICFETLKYNNKKLCQHKNIHGPSK